MSEVRAAGKMFLPPIWNKYERFEIVLPQPSRAIRLLNGDDNEWELGCPLEVPMVEVGVKMDTTIGRVVAKGLALKDTQNHEYLRDKVFWLALEQDEYDRWALLDLVSRAVNKEVKQQERFQIEQTRIVNELRYRIWAKELIELWDEEYS